MRARAPRNGRVPPLPTSDHIGGGSDESPREAADYWSDRDRWAALGKRVADLRDEAKRQGVPIESLPGARSLIENFKSLGRRLDRRTR